MGQAKRTRKFAEVKRVISKKDARRRENADKADEANQQKPKTAPASADLIREIPQQPSSMFFQHNEALVPPYSVLVDTNFLSHTISRKLPLLESLMDLLVCR
jgi:U3 small nucleolar RNA-associated protein 24